MEDERPIAEVGSKIRVVFPTSEHPREDERRGVIAEVLKCSSLKHGSWFKYSIRFKDNNEVVTTRLRHLEFKLKKKLPGVAPSTREKRAHIAEGDPEGDDTRTVTSKKQKTKEKKVNSDNTEPPTRLPATIAHRFRRRGGLRPDWLVPTHSKICAPMVGGSELAFRLLCRRYGCDLAYTPMISSTRFAEDAEYRKQEFQTTPEDRPLVAHFSGNNPQQMLKAAKFVEKECDAIDLNLGCPQRVAFVGHYGSFLLDDEDRPLVLSIVRTLAAELTIPVFVKIRLLSTLEKTIELCRQLADAGAALIAIHARHRVNLVNRTGPGARDGAAFLDQVTDIRKAISKDVVIISNGNIRTHADIAANMELTQANGVMSAEGLLDNPAIFSTTDHNKNRLELALEYLSLVDKYPVKMKSVVFHIRRIARDELNDYQLMEELCACDSVEKMREILLQCKQYQEDGSYQYDPEKELRAKRALEKRKHEEGKRKRYEARMTRKAKREGKDPSFYLSIGAENPTLERLRYLKTLSQEEAFAAWKDRHSQHCFDYHFNAKERCKRDRTCAFLHADPVYHSGDAEVYG